MRIRRKSIGQNRAGLDNKRILNLIHFGNDTHRDNPHLHTIHTFCGGRTKSVTTPTIQRYTTNHRSPHTPHTTAGSEPGRPLFLDVVSISLCHGRRPPFFTTSFSVEAGSSFPPQLHDHFLVVYPTKISSAPKNPREKPPSLSTPHQIILVTLVKLISSFQKGDLCRHKGLQLITRKITH